jgi:hypothetical protein
MARTHAITVAAQTAKMEPGQNEDVDTGILDFSVEKKREEEAEQSTSS